ncbi:hypothetical protein TNIN_268031 [Trichonephila inaurata madagascariensis]|uniref:Uncharacterized protein n=1 Tax=Trichonephila inaurata madagascariensis TaxID=2747483 RepID=A0A8X6XRA1_9ARAC|nr:hypothetical protein TNIN_268031 [Trichonephila inaurata madagascariensis]
MIEAAVSRKNMWLVRVAAVTLGRSGCPCVPFCLHSDPPPPVLVEVGNRVDVPLKPGVQLVDSTIATRPPPTQRDSKDSSV